MLPHSWRGARCCLALPVVGSPAALYRAAIHRWLPVEAFPAS